MADHDTHDHTGIPGCGGGGGGTVTSAVLTTGDVTLPQNTWTDILSLSLAAGTYVIMAMANLQSVTGAQDVDIRIQNTTDTATLASGAASITATSFDWTVSVVCTVVLGGTKTVKLQGNASAASGGKALQAIQSNSTGNNAVQIVALKIA